MTCDSSIVSIFNYSVLNPNPKKRTPQMYALDTLHKLEHLQMEMQSANRANTSPDFLPQLTLGKPEIRVSPISKGTLQMIADMTAWLDSRKVLLERTGQWPKLN
jgi:hypothetical protein